MKERLRVPLVVVLLLLHWTLGVTSLSEKSPAFDEISHLTAGYSYWLTGDYRLHPENGVLPQLWGGLPLRFGSYRFPSLEQPAWWKSDEYAVGYHFFYSEGNDLAAMLARARAAMALLSIPLGLLVYAWSCRLFGTAGGLVSLALFVFSPTMLAHGPLITSDLAATLFFTASLWAYWTLIHRVSIGTVLASVLAMSGLFLSKMSAPLVIPMALLLLGVRLVVGRPLAVQLRQTREIIGRSRQLAVLGVVGVVHVVTIVSLLWAFYGFRYSAFNMSEPGRDTLGWEEVQPIPRVIQHARSYRVLPEAYLIGLADVLHQAQTRRAFLNGEHSWQGWWSFFPYAFAVKTPLPTVALLLIAIGLAAAGYWSPSRRQRAAVIRGLYDTAPLWALLAIYWGMAITSSLNIGHRHLLPTYPALFILAGSSAACFRRKQRVVSAVVVAALGALVVESVIAWPHYLAYFNQLVGGSRHGYRHLVDSSLDWGQDLPGLKRWLDRHRGGEPVYLSYFGTGQPEYYGIEATRLPGHYDHWRRREQYELTGGIYAVSATMLQSIYSRAPGPWAVPYERAYQAALAKLRAIAQTADPDTRKRLTRDFVTQELAIFEQLQFARLCAFLRQREPDDQVGYSILIYRLSAEDVREALHGPPAELVPKVEVVGWEASGS